MCACVRACVCARAREQLTVELLERKERKKQVCMKRKQGREREERERERNTSRPVAEVEDVKGDDEVLAHDGVRGQHVLVDGDVRLAAPALRLPRHSNRARKHNHSQRNDRKRGNNTTHSSSLSLSLSLSLSVWEGVDAKPESEWSEN